MEVSSNKAFLEKGKYAGKSAVSGRCTSYCAISCSTNGMQAYVANFLFIQ